jgi:hypothetical protein
MDADHRSEPRFVFQVDPEQAKQAVVVLVLATGIVLTGAWIAFLGWAAVQVVSWAVG